MIPSFPVDPTDQTLQDPVFNLPTENAPLSNETAPEPARMEGMLPHVLSIGLLLMPSIGQTYASWQTQTQLEPVEETKVPVWKARIAQAIPFNAGVLHQKLMDEVQRRADYLTHPSYLTQGYAWSLKLGELPFERATVELAPENVIRFTLIFESEVVALIDLPLDQPGEPAVFSLFQHRERLLSELMPLDQVVEGLHRWTKAG